MVFNGGSFQPSKPIEEVGAAFPDDLPDTWLKIAEIVCGKSEIDVYMQALLKDLKEIDSGKVELPDSSYSIESLLENISNDLGVTSFGLKPVPARCKTKKKERSFWTKAEHRLFLIGLQKYGKGNWNSISRFVVKTRTSVQIASHAQKYFIRQKALAEKNEKKRVSIYDMSVDDLDTQAAEVLSLTESESISDKVHEISGQQVRPTQSYGSNHSPIGCQLPMQEAPLNYMPLTQFRPELELCPHVKEGIMAITWEGQFRY
ncbi:hypothetical protein AMTRI_Chr12g273190 [Amborella trichopoda]